MGRYLQIQYTRQRLQSNGIGLSQSTRIFLKRRISLNINVHFICTDVSTNGILRKRAKNSEVKTLSQTTVQNTSSEHIKRSPPVICKKPFCKNLILMPDQRQPSSLKRVVHFLFLNDATIILVCLLCFSFYVFFW